MMSWEPVIAGIAFAIVLIIIVFALIVGAVMTWH